MYKLEFTLKQHTPIIHFQHDQDGATLRATEVKPKLDRFIIEKYGMVTFKQADGKNKLIPKEEFKHLFIGEGKKHLALDYKLNLNSNSVKVISYNISKDNPIPTYFGSLSKDDIKSLNFIDENFLNEIITKNESIYKKLKECLSEFFVLNNFGTRQSKGFGAFAIIPTEEIIETKFNDKFRYSFNLYDLEEDWLNKSIQIFKNIDWFYRSLRSGLNVKDNKDSLYFKSALFMYLNNRTPQIQWDKKTIKVLNFKNSDLSIQDFDKKNKVWKPATTIKFITSQNKQHNYPDILDQPITQNGNLHLKNYRDLFGLSTKETWYSYRAELTKKQAKINASNRWEPVEEKNADVTRYKSPLIFKPILNNDGSVTVYCDYHPRGDEDILFKYNFILGVKYEGNPYKIKPPISHLSKEELVLPFANDFDFDKFFTYSFKNINPSTHIVGGGGKQAEIKKSLIDIYSQLKEQVK